ncbi:MAG: TrkH family potassium uptake protein [Clostridia bacterium]|nr:TrkH family potassium uptake protein [Clostridia bacterium]
MNYRIISHTVGRILQLEAALLLLPLFVSLLYRETDNVIAFLISAAAALAVGLLLTYVLGKDDRLLFAREGFAIVALAWLAMSAVGALPYVISGAIPSYADAFFETVSGFTTTSATILNDVENLSNGIIFWRSFTHWLGGMGVLVFIMAIFPQESGRSIHIMRAEMPGPTVGKLVPKLKETARILYLIYIGITIVEAILLFLGGMSPFESFVHAFGTAGTSGFAIKADGLASYAPHLQWMVMVFMLIGGINFNLIYLMLIGHFRPAVKSTELWVYLIIIVVAGVAVTFNVMPIYGSFWESLRQAFFHVISIVTTTGYSISDYNEWPLFSKTLLVVLMFVGGCAGSTSGGIKISRFILLIKAVFRDIKQMLHPTAVSGVRFDGKKVDDKTIHGVSTYFAFYFIIFFVILMLISFEPFDFETNFTAVSACLNNIGPGFGAVGPLASFSAYSVPAKFLLSFAMLLGRLEIFPILLLLMPSFWARK